jgi:hypothetical protein
MPELCLYLLCPASLEEQILDVLLMHPDLVLFTSTRTAAHGLAFGALSANEQVLGRALATEIQVLVRASDKDALLETVRQEFPGAGLRYWITPVTQAGDLA